MKFGARVIALVLSLVLLPSVASAVSVESREGVGKQDRIASYNNGAAVTGTLKSKRGHPVYYQGRINWKGKTCSTSTVVGRYTKDTKSKTLVVRGGRISQLPGRCTATSVQSRATRNMPGLPDAFGFWSAKY